MDDGQKEGQRDEIKSGGVTGWIDGSIR